MKRSILALAILTTSLATLAAGRLGYWKQCGKFTTETFSVTSNKWTLTWQSQQVPGSSMSFTVRKAEDGQVVERVDSFATSDTILIRRGPGQFFIDISASSFCYTITATEGDTRD